MAIAATQLGRLFVLQLAMPGNAPVSAGVLLEDPSGDRLYLRLRRDWDVIAPTEAVILSELESDLEAKSQELGAARVLDQLQDTLSNTVTISSPREVMVEDFGRALGRLYRKLVQSTVRPFVTHLPRYSLAVAAGKFLENHDVTEEGWEEAPAGLNPTAAMFVARIAGRSMEPRIPDGSLCVFRAGVVGSREGRLVLVEYLGGGANDRHTVKRYHSRKRQRQDGTWDHDAIRLEPLNPEFETWELTPEEDRFRIVAEFVQVLD
jgi:SOS-response transcriptional repressor LexA